jgi:hypothetical protein
MTPRTPQCEVFWALLSSSKHSRVPKDSKSPTFPSVGLHPHTWPKWGCDKHHHHSLFYHDQVPPIKTKLNLVATRKQEGGGLRGVDLISNMTTFVNMLLLILP